MSRAFHPQRLSRALMSSRNPAMKPVEQAAVHVRTARSKAAPSNPYLAAEALWVDGTEQVIDFWRDVRDMSHELTFFRRGERPGPKTSGAHTRQGAP